MRLDSRSAKLSPTTITGRYPQGEMAFRVREERTARKHQSQIRIAKAKATRVSRLPRLAAVHLPARLDHVLEGAKSGARRADQHGHVARPVLVVPHPHMRFR